MIMQKNWRYSETHLKTRSGSYGVDNKFNIVWNGFSAFLDIQAMFLFSPMCSTSLGLLQSILSALLI
jgi:hypothetical protein